MPKLSVYLDKDREKKLAEIKEAVKASMKPKIKLEISVDVSKSKLIGLAIDKLHELVVGKGGEE